MKKTETKYKIKQYVKRIPKICYLCGKEDINYVSLKYIDDSSTTQICFDCIKRLQIEKGIFTTNQGVWCSWCGYKKLCPLLKRD